MTYIPFAHASAYAIKDERFFWIITCDGFVYEIDSIEQNNTFIGRINLENEYDEINSAAFIDQRLYIGLEYTTLVYEVNLPTLKINRINANYKIINHPAKHFYEERMVCIVPMDNQHEICICDYGGGCQYIKIPQKDEKESKYDINTYRLEEYKYLVTIAAEKIEAYILKIENQVEWITLDVTDEDVLQICAIDGQLIYFFKSSVTLDNSGQSIDISHNNEPYFAENVYMNDNKVLFVPRKGKYLMWKDISLNESGILYEYDEKEYTFDVLTSFIYNEKIWCLPCYGYPFLVTDLKTLECKEVKLKEHEIVRGETMIEWRFGGLKEFLLDIINEDLI